jgi:hypothetical protein
MRNRQIISGVMLLFILTVMIVPISFAQEPARGGAGQRGPAPPPTNLQVLPKDWTRQQVQQLMGQFTSALGVNCAYCHAEREGAQPGPNGQVPIDPASDAKQTKKTARVMIKMVSEINNTLSSQLGKQASDVTKVQCVTCHRGSAIPKTQ